MWLGKSLTALCCGALLAGCASTGPVADQFKVCNPFGTLFRTKEEVLRDIPVGTPAAKAQAAMRAHGFEEYCSQRQKDRQALVYHVYDPGRLRTPSRDIWVTLSLRRGTVVDAEVFPGALGPAAPVPGG
jgi:hypothetical protein